MLWSKTRETDAAEALQLVFLAGEGLDDADPGDVLLGLRGQLGEPLLDLLLGGPGDAVVARGGVDDERGGGEGDQRQPGVDREHHGAGEDDRQQVLGDEDQSVAEEEADRAEVDRRPRHQLAGLLAVEEAQLEPLQVGVEHLPQVEFDRQRDLAGDQAADHGQPQAQDRGAEDRQRQRQEVGLVAALDRVDGAPDQPWDQHRHPHRRPGERQRSPELGTIGTQEAHQAAVRVHSHPLYKVKYWSRRGWPRSPEALEPGQPLSLAAALALGTLPFAHGFGPWPGRGRIWKLVTAWTCVIAPLFWARLRIRR